MFLEEMRAQFLKDIEQADRDAMSAKRDGTAMAFIGEANGLRRAVQYIDKIASTGKRVTVLPCQVGDSLWCLVGNGCSVVAPMTVDNIYLSKFGVFIGLSGNGKYLEITGEDVGKIAFWSEAEAVAARDECLRVVDEVLCEAVTRNDSRIQGGSLWDPMEKETCGLIEEF